MVYPTVLEEDCTAIGFVVGPLLVNASEATRLESRNKMRLVVFGVHLLKTDDVAAQAEDLVQDSGPPRLPAEIFVGFACIKKNVL